MYLKSSVLYGSLNFVQRIYNNMLNLIIAYCYQLGFRCVRSTNNETRVERNRFHFRQTMHLSKKF